MKSVKEVVRQRLKKGEVTYVVFRYLYRMVHDFWDLTKGCFTYVYLRHKVMPIMKSTNSSLPPVMDDVNVIWVCWLQGIEQAPDIVKKCYKRLTALEKHRIIVITNDNFEDYVNIPEYILDKYNKGIISPTHFSDILRATLLYQHGGLWLDATIYLTSAIPPDIWAEKLFAFRWDNSLVPWDSFSSHFLRAHAGDIVLGSVLKGLWEYWEKNTEGRNYFLFHYLFYFAIHLDEKSRAIAHDMLTMYSEENHILQSMLFDDYNSKTWKWIERISFMQKLTYKFSEQKIKGKTYYMHIMSQQNK